MSKSRLISALRTARDFVRRAYLLPVRLYQATLSRWLGGQCRFVPSCSNYFIEAVMKKGIFVGTAKGIWRICRCNPLSKGGYDPVDKPRDAK